MNRWPLIQTLIKPILNTKPSNATHLATASTYQTQHQAQKIRMPSNAQKSIVMQWSKVHHPLELVTPPPPPRPLPPSWSRWWILAVSLLWIVVGMGLRGTLYQPHVVRRGLLLEFSSIYIYIYICNEEDGPAGTKILSHTEALWSCPKRSSAHNIDLRMAWMTKGNRMPWKSASGYRSIKRCSITIARFYR